MRGVLLVTSEVVARDLLEYGEDAAADWVQTCTDDDLVRVCSVAYWLIQHGPSTPAGNSMMLSKACALAAVYIKEGAPRDLSRSRRKPLPPLTAAERELVRRGRWVKAALQDTMPTDYAVGADAREYWTPSLRISP